jgi:hypothetical protein
MDGSEKQKLSDDKMDKVVVDGDYIYYTTPYNSPVMSIYRMNNDGSDVRKLLDADIPWFITFNVYDGNVYYATWHNENGLIVTDGLYCLPDNGLGSSSPVSIGRSFNEIWTADGAIYSEPFMDNGAISLYKLDNDGGARLINSLQVY